MSFFKSNDLDDKTEYPGMVHWFSPIPLLKLLEDVIPSTLFEKYADGRLIHAALDSVAPDTIIETCCGGSKGIVEKTEGEPMWVDYVADLGDGFDSTYAIAYMIGQRALEVGPETFNRADCLIMGGDEVYPDASRDDYYKRLQRPYRAAFPRTHREGDQHPHLYLIPGNHDWYDGLKLFSALFCNGEAELGSWMATQRRSYFAIHLGNNWWIWGFDSQLDEDVDKPQSEYFDAVAERMEPGAKVVLCGSVPTWLHASLTPSNDLGTTRFYQGVHFMASKLHRKCRDVKIPLVLSGDTHHYNRYVSKEFGTHFVTAGGGGAFLHPTHGVLQDSFEMKWLDGKVTTLEIGRDTDDTSAIYPPPSESRQLALGNRWFWLKNWDFSFMLASLYLLCGLAMLCGHGYGKTNDSNLTFARLFWDYTITVAPTPIFVAATGGLVAFLWNTASMKSRAWRRVIATVHAIAHAGIILFGTVSVATILSMLGVWRLPFGETAYLVVLLAGAVVLGFIGAFVWGLYLTLVSYVWGDEANSAFSAMRLDSYKHFLRIKIEDEQLTIYPIGIKKAPSRGDWQINPAFDEDRVDQNIPYIIPRKPLGQHLIEEPVVIKMNDVRSTNPA